MADLPQRIRLEYPGGPTYRAKVVDADTGALVPGVTAVEWAFDARAQRAAPQLVVRCRAGVAHIFHPSAFAVEAETAEREASDGE